MNITAALRISALSLLLVSSVALGGCANTVNGAGRDIERAGEEVQRYSQLIQKKDVAMKSLIMFMVGVPIPVIILYNIFF